MREFGFVLKRSAAAAMLLLAISAKASGFSPQRDTIVRDTIVKEKKRFELSLGQSLLFISNSRLADIRKNEAVVVPTSAVLLFIEFRPVSRLRIPIFANIPTESKQFIVNNQLVNERASPTLGTGLQFRCFSIPIGKRSAVQFEAGPLAS